jgi:DNA topoisomerase III
MTDLILTEKFSVAADFAKALGVNRKGDGCFEGAGFIITWAVGHLVTLYEPDEYDPALKKWRLDTLPLIPDSFEYKPIKKTYKQFKAIKKLLTQRPFDRVIIATDAGREGEVIARTILLKIGFLEKARILRFWTSQALVPEVVQNAMRNLRPITDYDRLWRAGYYRQVSDWLIGMNCTRVLTVRLKDLFSVGRVQTAVLAMLTDRKKEREQFEPKPYWTLNILFAGNKGNWTGGWFKNKVTRLTLEKEAQALYQRLNQATLPGQVQSVTREKKNEPPPLLFSLTDLQQAANKRFGFPATKTLTIAQGLYQDKKCLSYPRTDSRVLGTQNLAMVQKIIHKLAHTHPDIFTGIDAQRVSLSNKRVFNDAKLTDHHGLIPFKPLPAGASLDEIKIFDLVISRFAAAFHGDCEFESTRVVTGYADETFQTRGRVILVQGWRSVYQEAQQEKESGELIPPLVQGDAAMAQKIQLEEKQTTPSPDYTDALLLKDMTNPGRYVSQAAIKKFYRGETGIGTQSTRAQIIETLIARKYIARSGKRLVATDKGSYLVEMLRRCPISSVLTSPEETARWEMNLNQISLGEAANTQFLVNMKRFVTQAVNELKTAEFELKNFKAPRPARTRQQVPPKAPACPLCGGQIIEGKKGVGCANWRPEQGNCLFVIWKEISGRQLTPENMNTLLKGKTTRSYVLLDTGGNKFKAKLRMIQSADRGFVIEILPEDTCSIMVVSQIPCSR